MILIIVVFLIIMHLFNMTIYDIYKLSGGWKMETNVYFVRHAQPDFSVKDDLIRPLSEKGLGDAKKVTKILMDKDITSIYSSPFKRAIDTINDFANKSQIEIITVDDFCERRVGQWVEDFKSFSQKQWKDFNFKLDRGESLDEVQKRNINALFSVIRDNIGKNVVVATHGTALSTIINYFNPTFNYEGFLDIVDKMPYVLRFKFTEMELQCIEEIEFEL